jgi:hypothetical protein
MPAYTCESVQEGSIKGTLETQFTRAMEAGPGCLGSGGQAEMATELKHLEWVFPWGLVWSVLQQPSSEPRCGQDPRTSLSLGEDGSNTFI